MKDTLIILDAGHGSDTQGKRAGELREWIFNRDIVKFIAFELKALSIPHHVLVPGHYDVALKARSAMANELDSKHDGSTILVSVHGNAFEDENVSGLETWYASSTGKKLAAIFQEELVSELGWTDRGIKKGNFWIIKRTSMPAILTENGFYTNPHQREEMMTAEYRYRIAMAHIEAIKRVIN